MANTFQVGDLVTHDWGGVWLVREINSGMVLNLMLVRKPFIHGKSYNVGCIADLSVERCSPYLTTISKHMNEALLNGL